MIPTHDLAKLNSLTKYPSIPTYHVMEQGICQDEVAVSFDGEPEVIVTEKIDGTNARILLTCHEDGVDDTLFGSREELLFARGDRVANPSMGIVEVLRPIAAALPRMGASTHLFVLYGEVYGGRVQAAAKHYRGDDEALAGVRAETVAKVLDEALRETIAAMGGTIVRLPDRSFLPQTGVAGFRLFDVATMTREEAWGPSGHLVTKTREEIATWRDNGGQSFVSESELGRIAALAGVALTPRIVPVRPPPASVAEVLAWLGDVIGPSRAGLGGELGPGRAEGVVVRTPDRRKIAKIRFEDYDKTLRVRAKRGKRAGAG